MPNQEYFHITAIHRDDLEERGFDTSVVDDATMNKLARKMADAYINQSFWDDLDIIADSLGIPRKEGHDMCKRCNDCTKTWRNDSGELQCDNCGWSETS